MDLSSKEESSLSQMSHKVSVVQVAVDMAQRMAQKICHLFCCPLDSLLFDKVTCCPGHREYVKDKVMQVPPWHPPSTILIINISNSTLKDCVIGKDPYPSTVAEQQPLMSDAGVRVGEPTRCSCRHGQQGATQQAPLPPSPPQPPPLPPPAESQSINIHDSSLSCVIIGDNNYMQVENADLLE